MAYKHRIENGRADSRNFAVGRLVHSLVFEPDTVNDRYAIWDGGIRRGKDWDAFKEERSPRTIVDQKEIAECRAMAQAVLKNEIVSSYRRGGQFERAIFWRDSATGLRCKARPDWINEERRTLIDLKSCLSIEERMFGKVAARYGYHCQLAHYANGIETVLGWKPAEVMIVAVEKEAPHDVAVFDLSEDEMWAGAEEVAELLGKVERCQRLEEWPGRYEDKRPLHLPAWVFPSESLDDYGLQVG